MLAVKIILIILVTFGLLFIYSLMRIASMCDRLEEKGQLKQ